MSSAKSLKSIANQMAAASAAVTSKNQASADKQMAFQAQQNQQAMAFNAEEAQKNRDWQTQMSNTAHQREVKDLIKAGLNPVLSANAGASTPSGATASGYSSSGASASADNSYINAISSIYAQELQRETQLDIARINQQTQLETAKLGYDASLATANISAATQKAINDATIDYNKYHDKYFGSPITSLASSAGLQIGDAVTTLFNAVKSGNAKYMSWALPKAEKAKTAISKSLANLQKNIKPNRS